MQKNVNCSDKNSIERALSFLFSINSVINDRLACNVSKLYLILLISTYAFLVFISLFIQSSKEIIILSH